MLGSWVSFHGCHRGQRLITKSLNQAVGTPNLSGADRGAPRPAIISAPADCCVRREYKAACGFFIDICDFHNKVFIFSNFSVPSEMTKVRHPNFFLGGSLNWSRARRVKSAIRWTYSQVEWWVTRRSNAFTRTLTRPRRRPALFARVARMSNEFSPQTAE